MQNNDNDFFKIYHPIVNDGLETNEPFRRITKVQKRKT